jgi:hypothetical protein
MSETENLVLILLREMRDEMISTRAEMTNVRADIATKRDLADVHSRINSLAGDVASDLLNMEKRLGDQIFSLRRAVMDYHGATIGHGVLINEYEERLRRVEQHLNIGTS